MRRLATMPVLLAFLAFTLLASGRSLPAHAAGSATMPLATPAYAVQMLGINDSNDLLLWQTSNPAGTFQNLGPLGIADPDATGILGMTLRPSTGQVYLLTSNLRIGILNPVTRQVSLLTPGSLPISAGSDTPVVPMAIDPVTDVIRILGDDNQNYRVSPVTGLLLGTDSPLDRDCPWTTMAASRPFRGGTPSTLYTLDTTCPELGHLGGLNGAPPPPASGQSFSLGGVIFPDTTAFIFQGFLSFPPGTQAATVGYLVTYEFDADAGPAHFVYSLPVTGSAPYTATRLGQLPVEETACGCGVIVASVVLPTGVLEMAMPQVSVSETAGSVTVNVSRLAGSWDTTTVTWTTQNGTAQAGVDYVAGGGTLTFPQGETSQAITVAIINNPAGTGNRFFDIVLTGVSANTNAGSSLATRVTIIDASPALVAFAGPGFSVLESAGTASVKVLRTGNSSLAGSVAFATSNGTAAAGIDYVATSGTIPFTPGQTAAFIQVPLIPNPAIDNKTFLVTLSAPSAGFSLGPVNPTTVTIVDDLSPPTMQWTSPAVSVAETAGFVTVPVSRLGSLVGTSTVQYATADGSAVAGRNYTATSGTLQFLPGVASLPVTVPILFDPDLAGNVDFTISLSNATGGGTGTPVTTRITILDPGSVPLVQFGAASVSVAEGSAAVTLPLTRLGNLQDTTAVQWATRDGTALAGVNYVAASGTATFLPGQNQSSITVTLLEEGPFTPSKTFFVDLGAVTAGKRGVPSTVAVTIVDPSAPPVLRFAAAEYRTSEASGQVLAVVQRLGNTATPVTVSFATQDGTARAGIDYVATSGTLDFAAGQASAIIAVTLINHPEPQTVAFRIVLAGPTGGAILGSPDVAIVQILPMHSRMPVLFRAWSGGW